MAKKPKTPETREPIYKPVLAPLAFAGVFGGLLFAGLGLLPALCIVPWWNWLEARNWPQSEATITLTDESLAYEYQWQGQRFVQTSFALEEQNDGTVSAAKKAFLAQHKPGDKVPVYVNPEDPAEGILDRELRMENPDGLEFALIFGAFFVIPGSLMLFFSIRKFVRYIVEVRRFKAAYNIR